MFSEEIKPPKRDVERRPDMVQVWLERSEGKPVDVAQFTQELKTALGERVLGVSMTAEYVVVHAVPDLTEVEVEQVKARYELHQPKAPVRQAPGSLEERVELVSDENLRTLLRELLSMVRALGNSGLPKTGGL
jgi:hypothetical protein